MCATEQAVLGPTASVYGPAIQPLWVPKGWGGELWFANDVDHGYCGKKLLVIGGKRNSWHYHNVKDEVFIIDSGVLELRFSPVQRQGEDNLDLSERVTLRAGQALHVPNTMRHQLIGIETCWLTEVSSLDFPGDTVRLIKGD